MQDLINQIERAKVLATGGTEDGPDIACSVLDDVQLALADRSRKPVTVTMRGGRKVETKTRRLEVYYSVSQALKDDARIAKEYAEILEEEAKEGYKLTNTLTLGQTNPQARPATILVFERATNPSRGCQFHIHDLVKELRKLVDPDVDWTISQKIQLKRIPEGFTEFAERVANMLDPQVNSLHLIPADEMALIIMRVYMMALPNEEFRQRWERSVRESRETGDGQYDVHIRNGVVDLLDDLMTARFGDPGGLDE